MRQQPQDIPSVSLDERGRPSADTSAAHHPRGRLFPLSIRTSFVVVLLVPLLIVLGVSSTVVAHQLSTRQQAESARQSSLDLDALLRARVDLYNEYIPSQAIVVARSYQVSPSMLNSLLGVDVQTELVDSRRTVDRQAAFGATGAFRIEFAQLARLRRGINNATASASEVATVFNRIGVEIEGRWQSTFNRLSQTGASSDSPTTKSRLNALDLSFSAFTSGLGEENLQGGGSLETLLTTTATSAQVQSLVVSQDQFEASTRSFPGSLGPHGASAWRSLTDGPLTKRFAAYVQSGIAVGLGHLAPPLATTSADIGEIGRAEVAWASSLTNVVLASSIDLRTATADQATSATHALILTYALTSLLVILALVAVLVLSRQVRRPLDHIVAAATSVRGGELDIPALDESGPRELALAAAAFNEMASTLRTVQAQAIALSDGDLDDPVLRRQLPGRTGAALQTALNQLHRSVQAGEAERDALLERATRDSLTGLLNRGAALEALELDMASVRRSRGELALALFFIDLDDLKAINDSIGHDGGDAAIRAVAEALKVTTRASDVIARFGGDEFVVGWLGNRNSHVPEQLARRISAHVAQSEIGYPEHTVALACSIGVAISETSDLTVETLIERADRALYDAKGEGKGQIRWFDGTVSTGSRT
ncbi:MAG TPA: diguanylate cyclase [Acidimicrobiales bacterium]|nr:diguanylate cyclase [Acidimicrobiales bacterium]